MSLNNDNGQVFYYDHEHYWKHDSADRIYILKWVLKIPYCTVLPKMQDTFLEKGNYGGYKTKWYIEQSSLSEAVHSSPKQFVVYREHLLSVLYCKTTI